jgi:RNA polymerase-binding transcription factor DksA
MANQEEKNFYTRDELQEFRTLIEDKLEVARKEVKELAEDLKAGGGDVADGYNYTDYGVDTQEKEQIEILMARQERFIDGLEKALIRIQNGTYGVCRVTGNLISKGRLKAVPHTTTSIEAKLQEKDQPRRD